MSKLTRTRAGIFDIKDALTLAELEDVKAEIEAHLMPLDYPLRHWPALTVDNNEDMMRVNNGNHIKAPADLPAGMIRIYDSAGTLMAVAKTVSEPGYYLAQPLKVFK
jgi:tRNA U55 pseudouridine synthase TruB